LGEGGGGFDQLSSVLQEELGRAKALHAEELIAILRKKDQCGEPLDIEFLLELGCRVDIHLDRYEVVADKPDDLFIGVGFSIELLAEAAPLRLKVNKQWPHGLRGCLDGALEALFPLDPAVLPLLSLFLIFRQPWRAFLFGLPFGLLFYLACRAKGEEENQS